MKASEIKQMGTEELQDALLSSQSSLRKLRFANTVTPLENSNRIGGSKKEIARIKTELHTRAIEEVSGKVKSGELNEDNAAEYLKDSKLASQMTLAKIRKIIKNSTK